MLGTDGLGRSSVILGKLLMSLCYFLNSKTQMTTVAASQGCCDD